MEKMTNEQIYNQVLEDMPAGMRGSYPSYAEAKTLNFVNLNLNDFIQTLSNKIGKMLYITQHFSNPYDSLIEGDMPYGYSVEQLFMENSTVKSLLENIDEDETGGQHIFNSSLPTLNGIVSNHQLIKKSKLSISQQRLKSAFYNEYGLEALINQTLETLRVSLNKDKYDETEKLLNNFAKGVDYKGEKLNFKQKPYIIETTNTIKGIIEMVENFTLHDTKHNPSKVDTQCLKSDIVIFVTPSVYGQIMASANWLFYGGYEIHSVKTIPNQVTNLSTLDTINSQAVVMDRRLLPMLLQYSGIEVVENPNSLELEYYYYECYNLPINTFSNYGIVTRA